MATHFTYTELPDRHSSGRPVYVVHLDGRPIGVIEPCIVNTDTKVGRLRRPGKGRPGFTRVDSYYAQDRRVDVARSFERNPMTQKEIKRRVRLNEEYAKDRAKRAQRQPIKETS